MEICSIVAISENRVIGMNNQLPWKLPADMKRLRDITTGHALFMGRKTYESIGRPLPNRENIILTRNPDYDAPGCTVVTSFEEALEKCQSEKFFVFGGEAIFNAYIDKVQTLYLTVIHDTFEGDTFFPELNMDEWQEASKEEHKADDKNPHDYTFYVYKRTLVNAFPDDFVLEKSPIDKSFKDLFDE